MQDSVAKTPLAPTMDHPVYEEVLQKAAAAVVERKGGRWVLNLSWRREGFGDGGAAAVAAALGGEACSAWRSCTLCATISGRVGRRRWRRRWGAVRAAS